MSLSTEQETLVNYLNLSDYQETSTNELVFNCPFCNDHRKKMYVSPSGKFICFLCETKGNSIVSFVAQLNDISFKEARLLLEDYDLDFSYDYNQSKEEQEEPSLFSQLIQLENKPMITSKVFPNYPSNTKDLILHTNEAQPFYDYLYTRGLTDKDIDDYHIKYVKKGKIKTPNKEFSIFNHIIFTTYDKDNNPIYWNTRSIEKDPKIKSLNGLSNQSNTYTRKDVIFNLNRVQDKMVICEGVFNAITCTMLDYVGVATFGKVITSSQKELIANSKAKLFYIFLDNDANQESYRLIQDLIYRYNVSQDKIRLVYNKEYDKDANDLGREKVLTLLDNAQPINLATLMQLQRGL